MRLLVTRPEPDCSRTAATLRARGHDVMLAPLLHVAPDPDANLGPGPWAALLITSANAVRAITAHPRRAALKGLRVYAVGRRSAEAARDAGFADVVSADGDAADLARLVAADPPAAAGKPLLWLAGEERAADLAAALAPHGLTVRTVVAYRALAETSLPPAVHDALAAGQVDGVLHYSRRSADAFLALVLCARIDLNSLSTHHYCMSSQVAEPFRQEGIRAVAVAPQPDEGALFALLGSG
jgi:uroporphyrinogen-III synthase